MKPVDFLHQTFDLTGRSALITGASSGIGAHLAGVLARAGCRVALTARRRPELAARAAAINAEVGAGAAVAVVLDVTDRERVDAALDEVVAAFGRVDILVNNAGIAAPQRLLEMTEEAWREVVDTDLTAVWRVGRAAARRMAQADGGVIINIASVLGLAAQRGQANYGAAKAGVIHLTRSMALELARHDIRVNALAPGYFATEINREYFATERGQAHLAGLLPGRAGELRELDGPALLLAGPAGSYLNGTVLTVDGGSLLGAL